MELILAAKFPWGTSAANVPGEEQQPDNKQKETKTCYRCGRTGHIATYCTHDKKIDGTALPLQKGKKNKKECVGPNFPKEDNAPLEESDINYKWELRQEGLTYTMMQNSTRNQSRRMN